MNKKELWERRKIVSLLYSTPRNPNKPRQINAVFPHKQNSDPHEIAKLIIGMELMRQGKAFISEAAEKLPPHSRRDIVCLDDGMRYEPETEQARADRHKGDKSVKVIMVDYPPEVTEWINSIKEQVQKL